MSRNGLVRTAFPDALDLKMFSRSSCVTETHSSSEPTPAENNYCSPRNETGGGAADLAGHHVEPLDVGDGLLRVDDRRVLVLHRGRLVLHCLDDPPLLALEALPVGVHHPLRVRHPAQQRPLERRPGGVVRERVLQKKSPENKARSRQRNQPNSNLHRQIARTHARAQKKQQREFHLRSGARHGLRTVAYATRGTMDLTVIK